MKFLVKREGYQYFHFHLHAIYRILEVFFAFYDFKNYQKFFSISVKVHILDSQYFLNLSNRLFYTCYFSFLEFVRDPLSIQYAPFLPYQPYHSFSAKKLPPRSFIFMFTVIARTHGQPKLQVMDKLLLLHLVMGIFLFLILTLSHCCIL
jgi:hypothetical protein